ncbi:flavorubredoxin [Bradyrhizobium sp. LM2.7]
MAATKGLAMRDQTFELVRDQLYLLGGVEQIDERISWYPAEDRGKFVAYNSYLLRSGNDCLLVESGAAAHHATIREQLRSRLREGDIFRRIAVTRNEPECVCNIPNLVRDFRIEVVHSAPQMSALQFFPSDSVESRSESFDRRSTELLMLEFGVQCIAADEGESISINGQVRLEPFKTPLRVLPSLWLHDAHTRTLFCSDIFCASVSERPEIRTNADVLSKDEMIALMLRELAIKFEWLSRGRLGGIIETLEDYFAKRDIEILAPTRGQVILGAEAVDSRLRALIAAMKMLDARDLPLQASSALSH